MKGTVGPASVDRESRRAAGRFYTPPALSRYLAERALAPFMLSMGPSRGSGATASRPLRILDPAMGEGALLQAALELLVPHLAPAEALGCLHGVELEERAARIARRRLGGAGAARRLLCGDLLAADGPLSGEGASFDVILGNPPWGGWDRRLDPARKAAYRARFSTARGRLEPASLFIESATRLLRPGGRLAFVLPDYLLLKRYPELRLHLLDHYDLEELVHHGRPFPGVNLDAFTLVARRRGGSDSTGETDRSVAPARCYPDGPGGPMLSIAQDRFRRAPGHRFNLSLSQAAEAALERIARRGALLGEWLEAHEGIHSGNVRARIFIPPGAAAGPRTRGGAARLTEPLLFGRDEIAPYKLRPAGWRVVTDPAAVRSERGEYASFGRPEWSRPPKLMIRRTGDRLIAALDREGLRASNNLFIARARPGCPAPLEYLEAWLNSALATACFRALQPRTGRLFAELKIVDLNRIPVPRPPTKAALARVLVLAAGAARGDPAAREGLDREFEALAATRPADFL